MIKRILSCLMATALAGSVQAQVQDYMVIEKTDGTQLKLGIDEIQQMLFTTEGNAVFGKEADAVDMGFCVKWASWDLGASAIGQRGGYYGWGDPTGELSSLNEDDYGGSNPPTCISGSKLDIARVQWGKRWRLPTFYEMEELLENCQWTYGTFGSENIVTAKAPNGQELVFPLAGYLRGSNQTPVNNHVAGYYNSGSVYTNNGYLWCNGLFCPKDSNDVYIYGYRRYLRMPVRPVFGDDVTVITNDPYVALNGYVTLYGTVAAAIGVSSYSRGFFITKGDTPSSSNYTRKVEAEGTVRLGWFSSPDISGLEPGTTYNYCAYVYADGTYYYGRTGRFATKEIEETLTVSSSSVAIESTAGASAKFSVSSNVGWTLTGVPEWLSVSATGGIGDESIVVTALSDNPSTTQQRTAQLTIATSKKNVKVTVSQKASEVKTIYREPYTTWGAAKTQVKSYMSSYTQYSEDTEMLVYEGRNMETLFMYMFENQKLYLAVVAINRLETTKDKIAEQLLKNGYKRQGAASYLFVSSDDKTKVKISESDDVDAYYVVYSPNLVLDELFEEPYLAWGASRSTVRTTVLNRGYTVLQESNNASDNYYLMYEGKKKESFSVYEFNSRIALDNVKVFILNSTASVDDLRQYLTSSMAYTYAGTNSAKTQFFHLSPDGKSYAVVMAAGSGDETAANMVYFTSYESVSSREMSRGVVSQSMESDKAAARALRHIGDTNTGNWQEKMNELLLQKIQQQDSM